MRAHLVLVSDARANAPAQGAFRAAVREAEIMHAAGLRALCVDTETGRLRLGNAERLALALGATYRHLEHCTERELGATLREWMAITA
jgi:Mg-chelatase subunit ChlD